MGASAPSSTMTIKRLSTAPKLVTGGAIYPYSEELLEKGERKTTFGDPYNLFEVVGGEGIRRIWVPRNMAPYGSEKEYSEGFAVNFTSKFKARHEEQTRVVDESVHLLLQDDNFITECPPGFGKTACAMEVIAQVGRKTIIIVTKEDIRDQWADAFKKFLGLEDADIGYIQADKFQITGKKVVIAMVHSLAKEGRYPAHQFREFGLAIFDECHRIGAEQFAKACFRLPAKLRWGLSATPDRKDGRLETIHAHLGPVRVKSDAAPMTPKVIVRKSPWRIPQTKITDPKTGQATIGPIPHTAGKCGHVINILSRNHHRNVMLADFAFQAYKKGRNVLVQSDRVEHLEMLALLIQKCGVPPGEFAFYVGGLTKEQREYAKTKRIIMACVSEDTECLTFEGWKDYSQLVTGELVATYNLQRKVIEYQPLLGVHTYDFSGKLCHVSRKSADILMTWNHRNVVEGRDGVQRVVRADELQRTHKIRTFSPMEYPEEVSIGVDLAALVGWVISEGSYHDGKRGKSGVKIYQNRGEKANAIRSLLNSLGMSFTERAYDSDLHQIMFRLSGKSGKVIRDLTPDKRLNKLLVSLPLTESQALFDSLIDGDGHRRKDNGNLMFIQKDKVTVDWFCILAMRLGYKPTVSSAEDSNGNHTYRVYLGHADLVSLSNGKHKVESKDYSGVVWCPSTPNTTWVARRNGTVFITGNTYQMTAEATDIPKMDTLVMGTPKSDIRQIIGRITRWVQDKKQPLIFDLVDDSSSVFKGYAKTRMELYVSLGAEINKTTVVKKSA